MVSTKKLLFIGTLLGAAASVQAANMRRVIETTQDADARLLQEENEMSIPSTDLEFVAIPDAILDPSAFAVQCSTDEVAQGYCWDCDPEPDRSLTRMYELNISPMGEVYEDEAPTSFDRVEGRFDGADYCDNIIPSFIHSLSAYCIKKSEIKDNVSDGNHLKDACSPLLGKLEDHCNSTPTVILKLKGEDPTETVDPSNLRMLTQESPMHHHVEEDFTEKCLQLLFIILPDYKASKLSFICGEMTSPASTSTTSSTTTPASTSTSTTSSTTTPASTTTIITPPPKPLISPESVQCREKGNAMLSMQECCDDDRRRTMGLEEHQPWAAPNNPDATLIKADPGIWKIDNFLDESTVTKMYNVFEDDNRFERCNGNPHDHLMCKQCFRLSISNSISDDEEKLVKDLMSKLSSLWPSQNKQRDYLYVQKTEPDCHPTKIHKDVTEYDVTKSATASVVFYLSEGDAGVFFPHADLVIPPEKGMALTWLNVHPDGEYNIKAGHGIQAMPKDGNVRYALSYRINLTDEEMVALQTQ